MSPWPVSGARKYPPNFVYIYICVCVCVCACVRELFAYTQSIAVASVTRRSVLCACHENEVKVREGEERGGGPFLFSHIPSHHRTWLPLRCRFFFGKVYFSRFFCVLTEYRNSLTGGECTDRTYYMLANCSVPSVRNMVRTYRQKLPEIYLKAPSSGEFTDSDIPDRLTLCPVLP